MMIDQKKRMIRRNFGYLVAALLLLGGVSLSARAANPLEPVNGCGALVINSNLSLNGYLNDQYQWYDSACRLRSAALARNDTSKGGNAKQFTYTLADGTTRTINPGDPGAGGFGYIVAHLSNPSFAWSYGADDSPLGSGNSATSTTLFAGAHHAIHEYTLNYVRYGLTQYALDHHSIDPWTWINGPDDPNRQYVTVYNVPVRIQWLFATGRDYPLWTVTFDLSAAPDHAIDSDFRAPYGDMNIDGGGGTDIVGGVAWGDSYKFVTSGSPFTMNNDWNYAQRNPGAPYDALWTATTDAEMGLAGTQIITRQNAGGYNNYLAPVWRGHTSANMGQLCLNDTGAGPAYDHKLPCTSDWAYQLIQYAVSSANETTSDKRLAWGADWGSLGNSSFVSTNGYAVSGYPKVSYSVYVVLDPHSKNPTQSIARQAETINLTTLTAAIGTVRTQGLAGIGRTDGQPYNPIGFNPIYGTWEVDALNNAADLTFTVPVTAPTTLDRPIIVIHNYTASPAQVSLDGVTLTANTDYFASLRPNAAELWITLNRQLTGTHRLQIANAATHWVYLPLVLRGSSNTVSPLVIYDDALATDWQDWSYSATANFDATNPVHSGAHAIAVTVTAGYGGLSVRAPTAISTAGYTAITFWVYAPAGDHPLGVYTQPSDAGTPSPTYLFTALASGWTQITVPLSALGSPSAIQRLSIQDESGAARPSFYLDEVRLTP